MSFMIPHQHESPHVPNTTFFQSEVNLPGEGQFGVRLVITNGNGFGGTPPVRGDAPTCRIEVDSTVQQDGASPRTGGVPPKDRKSKRLNSSHGNNSYAVLLFKTKD